MKANELMTGDWVYMEHTEDGVAPYKELIQWTKEDFGFSNMFIETHIYPVPLTPEILEKNGMKPFKVDRLLDKHSSAKWWAKGGDFFVKQYNFKHNNYEPTYSVGCNYHSLIIGLKYVHELQHALRLCGIEKEIIL